MAKAITGYRSAVRNRTPISLRMFLEGLVLVADPLEVLFAVEDRDDDDVEGVDVEVVRGLEALHGARPLHGGADELECFGPLGCTVELDGRQLSVHVAGPPLDGVRQ